MGNVSEAIIYRFRGRGTDLVGPLFFLCVSKLPIIATRRFAAPTGLPERKKGDLGDLSLVFFCWALFLTLLFCLYITNLLVVF